MKKMTSKRKQKGFWGSVDVIGTLTVVAALGAIAIPVIKGSIEDGDATAIVSGFQSIQRAAQQRYNGNYENATMSDIVNFLPEGFSLTAQNAETWDLSRSSTSKTNMAISLPIPKERLREKVLAQLNTDNASTSGNTVTLVTR